MFLINYWKEILTAVIALCLAIGAHALDITRIETKQQIELSTQAKSLIAECQKDKQLTTDISNDYETKLSALNHQLDTLRLQPSTCISVSTASGPARHTGSTRIPKLSGQNGVASTTLYSYAGEAEKYRLQLISCQSFVKKVWTARGQ